MKRFKNQLLPTFIHFLFIRFKFASIVAITCLFGNSLDAQSYGTALGVRLGDGIGLTVQQQVVVHGTVEGILSSSNKDLTLNVLYEHHTSLLTRGLNFYLGGGFYKTWIHQDDNLITQPTNPYGLSPIIGIELTIARKINLSADIKPTVRLGGNGGKGFEWHTGVSVRYVLAGRYFKDDGWKFWKKWKKK
jgi:hypothetical protein